MVTEETPLGSLSFRYFSECRGGSFRVGLEQGESVEMTLIRAAVLPASPGSSPRSEPFSLLFRGPGSPAVAQGMYQFQHGRLGSFVLFIVPVMPDADGPLYEAIFN